MSHGTYLEITVYHMIQSWKCQNVTCYELENLYTSDITQTDTCTHTHTHTQTNKRRNKQTNIPHILRCVSSNRLSSLISWFHTIHIGEQVPPLTWASGSLQYHVSKNTSIECRVLVFHVLIEIHWSYLSTFNAFSAIESLVNYMRLKVLEINHLTHSKFYWKIKFLV